MSARCAYHRYTHGEHAERCTTMTGISKDGCWMMGNEEHMKPEEALEILGQYDVNFYWTSGEHEGEQIPADKLTDAFEVAMDALRKRITGLKILEEERNLDVRGFVHKEYHRGRLIGLYDGLGIDYLGD